MKNNILILTLLLIFTGCSFKQEVVEVNHYSIDFKPEKIAQKERFNSIFIEEPNVNKSFNLTSIFYSTKPYLFEEYVKNRWISIPSNMVYNQVVDSFLTSNLFKSVVLKDKTVDYEYRLKTEIIKLYHLFEDGKSYAVLKIKFDLLKDSNVVKTYNFDEKILCKSNDAYGFVVATNEGFKKIINTLLSNL